MPWRHYRHHHWTAIHFLIRFFVAIKIFYITAITHLADYCGWNLFQNPLIIISLITVSNSYLSWPLLTSGNSWSEYNGRLPTRSMIQHWFAIHLAFDKRPIMAIDRYRIKWLLLSNYTNCQEHDMDDSASISTRQGAREFMAHIDPAVARLALFDAASVNQCHIITEAILKMSHASPLVLLVICYTTWIFSIWYDQNNFWNNLQQLFI